MTKYDLSRFLQISDDQIPAVKQLYPYPAEIYRDIRAATLEFLDTHCRDLPEETLIFVSINHNGHGYQWGVMLLKVPGETKWRKVARTKHKLFVGGIQGWLMHFSYYLFLLLGVTPKVSKKETGSHLSLQKGDIRTLKEFRAHCEWLNLPLREHIRRWLAQGAAA